LDADAGDGFRESGFSKERRLEPRITIGLLTDAAGFPLMVNAFEGNAAETNPKHALKRLDGGRPTRSTAIGGPAAAPSPSSDPAS
jgi:hypothetical protein